MKNHEKESGLTIIELLVTLFVAVAFLTSGYQIYSLIIRDGGDTRASTKASNTAYEYLNIYKNQVQAPCLNQTLLDETVEIEGLAESNVIVSVDCPLPSAPDISRISVTVNYGSDKSVVYSTYTSSDLDDSLVGWWPLNGDPNDYSGNGNHGTVSGAVPTTGQNERENSAYDFDGTDDYIEIPDQIPTNMNSFSISAWTKGISGPSANSNIAYILHRGVSQNVGDAAYWLAVRLENFYGGGVSGTNPENTGVASTLDTWQMATITYNGSNYLIYVNGQLYFTSATTAFTNTTTSNRTGIGSTPHNPTYRPFQGGIDDVRVYSRVLTIEEIQTIYDGGAR